MIEQAVIRKVVDVLRSARPDATIILFGSHARGDAREHSDLDLLVVEAKVKARRREMNYLSDLLRPLRIPADILVTSRAIYKEWSRIPGTVIYAAAREGKVLYAAA